MIYINVFLEKQPKSSFKKINFKYAYQLKTASN